jgi:metal-responsive CopG/Arc/MetJ family transcriptional regulator
VPRGKVSLWVRLSWDELKVIERFETEGSRPSEIVAEALRRYLQVVDAAGRFVQREITDRRKKSTFEPRHFTVDAELVQQLNEISARRGWPKSELIRQSVLTLGEQAEALSE